MQSIQRRFSSINYFLFATVCLMMTVVAHASDQDDPFVFARSHRWVSSVRTGYENILRITIHDGGDYSFITQGHRDHKPVWSKERDMITFFRATGPTDMKPFHLYRTHICVINADGTGFRKLTDAMNPNVNPTWTRDGSNRIIFNRLSKSAYGICQVYWMTADAKMNDAQLISNPDYSEWAESGLKDGRIFLYRFNANYIENSTNPSSAPSITQSCFLFDPKTKQYYPVERPGKCLTHKLSVSPSETRIVYMKDLDGSFNTYNDAVIAYAEFDLDNRIVKNELVISKRDKSHIDMYPRWSYDERFIIYSSSRGGTMWGMKQYMYNLDTKETHMISNPHFEIDMYPCFEDLPK